MRTFGFLMGFAISCWSCGGAAVGNDDWPGWRGADRTDVSRETGLLPTWPEGGPKQLWVNRNCGLGYAGFSVVENRLFTLGSEAEREFALCLDAVTGTEIWRVEVGDNFQNQWGDGPRSTPTVDGDRVYAMAANGNLSCLDRGSGQIIWQVSLRDLGGDVPQWGYAESPLIDHDRVVCTPGGNQGAIVALNKMTGAVIWRCTELTSTAHYSSIITANWNNRRQYIQLLVDALVGVDADNGRLLWSSPWRGRIAVIPTPIFWEGKVYATSGYDIGSKLVELTDDGAVDVWSNKVMKNHHGGVIQLGSHVYGFSDGNGFLCQSLETGEMVWTARRAIGKGAVSYADGRFYFIQEEDGQVLLIEANEEAWHERGRFTLSPQTERRKPQGRIWVHPVIANGRLYLRDQEIVCCYDISAQGEPSPVLNQ